MVAKVSYHTQENPSERILQEPIYINQFGLRNDKEMSPSSPESVSGINSETEMMDITESQRMPSFDSWAGPLGFTVTCEDPSERCPSHSFSSILGKIFVLKDNPFVVEVKLSNADNYEGLNIRAAAIYSRPSDVHEPLKRCMNHSMKDTLTSVGYPNSARFHFVRSDNPKSMYHEHPTSGRLSVVTPMFKPPPGSAVSLFVYRFMCLNSCISRKPLRILFTLEKDDKVIGRHSIDVRVCACPSRDRALEEKRHLKIISSRNMVAEAARNKTNGEALRPLNDNPSVQTPTTKNLNGSLAADGSRKRPHDDDVEVFYVKGKKMADTVRFILERLLLAEKCMKVYPHLLETVREEQEAITQDYVNSRKKPASPSPGPSKPPSTTSLTTNRPDTNLEEEVAHSLLSIGQDLPVARTTSSPNLGRPVTMVSRTAVYGKQTNNWNRATQTFVQVPTTTNSSTKQSSVPREMIQPIYEIKEETS